MPYRTDDQMWAVDKSFLGFPGMTFWRPVNYTMVGIGIGMALLLGIVLRGLLHLEGKALLWTWVILTIVLTRWLAAKLQRDTSFLALVRGLVNELRSPREPAPGKPIEFAAVSVTRRGHRRNARAHSPDGELPNELPDPADADLARTGQ